MNKEFVTMVSLAVIGFAISAVATSNRIVGVIAGVELQPSTTLHIVASKESAPTTVRTDEKTAFMKWVTHKPWQGNVRVDTSALQQGRCVEVEMSDSNVAKVVRVSDDPVGSVFDPCSHRR